MPVLTLSFFYLVWGHIGIWHVNPSSLLFVMATAPQRYLGYASHQVQQLERTDRQKWLHASFSQGPSTALNASLLKFAFL